MDDPLLNCDVVMKGGITSGIVYPGAVVELAHTYRFRSIGGTSAGAIAAGATAAAEYGRQMKTNLKAFEELKGLPDELGRPTGDGIPRLLSLFKPEPRTEALFQTLLAGAGGFGAGFAEAVRRYACAAILWGAIPLGLAAYAALRATSLPGALGAGALVLVAATLGLAGIALALKRDLLKRVPENGFGLCSGNGEGALTPWLHGLFQRLAGRAGGPVLTFGDLRKADVELKMMTTNLTQGRPYRLPIEEETFFFRKADLEKLFPPDVVEHMVKHGRPEPEEHRSDEFHPWPPPDDLPVIVATRMSLSFPVLFSAVPLYAVDYEKPADPEHPEGSGIPEEEDDEPAGDVGPPVAPKLPRGKRKLEPCWFSDGGISSNFPVHFFDSPLPGWPTFAINLRYLEAAPTADQRARMIKHNAHGLHEPWNRFEGRGLGGFVGAILESMQNWQDNALTRMPGYRDRVVHVGLAPDEGGLNLTMPEDRIRSLAERGREAGKMLARRFVPGSSEKLNWDNHRWIRLRSTLAVFEEIFSKLSSRLDPAAVPPQPGDSTYRELLKRKRPPSYRWENVKRRDRAAAAVEELYAIARDWKGTEEVNLTDCAPKPVPQLRTRPRV